MLHRGAGRHHLNLLERCGRFGKVWKVWQGELDLMMVFVCYKEGRALACLRVSAQLWHKAVMMTLEVF